MPVTGAQPAVPPVENSANKCVQLEQIQFLLGHASVVTTERYLGCKQNLEEPVNDRFGCLFSGEMDLRQILLSSVEN
jgi:hypothetical protein